MMRCRPCCYFHHCKRAKKPALSKKSVSETHWYIKCVEITNHCEDYNQCNGLTIIDGTIWIPDRTIGQLLARDESAVRLAGLSMLISSQSVTRPFTRGTLIALKRSFSPLFADTDAAFRGELLGLVARLVDRL